MIEWKFDRYREGNKMAEGGRVHALTFVEAETKVKKLFHNDPRETFKLRDAAELLERGSAQETGQ